MHARNSDVSALTFSPAIPKKQSGLIPVARLNPGQHFIRTDSPSEVLSLMSYAGMDCVGSRFTWAVVINTNHDSEGYVAGQLLKLRRDTLVRVVHEARAPVYALEQ